MQLEHNLIPQLKKTIARVETVMRERELASPRDDVKAEAGAK